MNLLDTVSLSSTDRFFIAGEWAKASTSAESEVVIPSTQDVWLRVAEAMEADLDRALAAREAFDRGEWARLTHAERADYMLKLADCARRMQC
jgi:aldehyde dehydrogenase (NAD+)